MKIGAGVYSRWNNAGLDSSICAIAQTSPMANAYGSTAENDTGAGLPRAEYMLEGEPASWHTVSYTLREAHLTINVYHNDSDALETALDLIEQNFDNCHNAGTNPLAVSGGTVIRCQYMDRTSGPVNENVYLGTVEFEIEVQRQNTTPA
jgi:hypothetical protein